MATSVYHLHMFLSGSSVFKMSKKMLKMIQHPSLLKTDGNIQKFGNLIRSDHQLSIRLSTESIGIDKECVR